MVAYWFYLFGGLIASAGFLALGCRQLRLVRLRAAEDEVNRRRRR
jgi:hypothetical protein